MCYVASENGKCVINAIAAYPKTEIRIYIQVKCNKTNKYSEEENPVMIIKYCAKMIQNYALYKRVCNNDISRNVNLRKHV